MLLSGRSLAGALLSAAVTVSVIVSGTNHPAFADPPRPISVCAPDNGICVQYTAGASDTAAGLVEVWYIARHALTGSPAVTADVQIARQPAQTWDLRPTLNQQRRFAASQHVTPSKFAAGEAICATLRGNPPLPGTGSQACLYPAGAAPATSTAPTTVRPSCADKPLLLVHEGKDGDKYAAKINNCTSHELLGQVTFTGAKDTGTKTTTVVCFKSNADTVVKAGTAAMSAVEVKVLAQSCDGQTTTSPPKPTTATTTQPTTTASSTKPTSTTPSSTTTSRTTTPPTTTPPTSSAPPPVNMVDTITRGIITVAVVAIVAVVGIVAAILQTVTQPPPPAPAAVAAPPPPVVQPRTGPPVCEGKLCAEFLPDGPDRGRLKVTFVPERDLPHGFIGVVTGPDDLELTGKSAAQKEPNATYTGYFDVGNGFRKDQRLCAKVFAIDGPEVPAKRGAQLGKEVCVVFLSDPR